MAPIVTIEDLHVAFASDGGSVRALAGVSLTLRRGRITGIVGESGSGKSVLAASILRLLPRNGRIERGRLTLERDNGPVDLAALPARGRAIEAIRGNDIGMVFQEPVAAFSPVHTIGNQMLEVIKRHRRLSGKAARQLAVDTLAKVGIANPAQRFGQYAFELSGGMRQRAMIATALVGQPRLLIADEPTTALDVTIQAQVLDLIRTVRAETLMAVMFITHDLGVVAQLADDIAVMYLGKIVEMGPVRAIFANPAHPYTRNLLAAVTARGGERGKLAAIPGQIPGPFDRPAGCPFHTRCAVSIAGRCEREEPPLTDLGAGHSAACLHLEAAP
jgi:oligopeptide/dipeptide ABC transporter ATP-binding protein